MLLSDLHELQVFDARGKSVGRLARALFDPSEPVLVGFEIRMRPFGYVLERPRRYVASAEVSVTSKQATLSERARLEKIGGRRSGIDWEQVVVWQGMPVRTVSGSLLGEVKDAEVDESGAVSLLTLTRGATSDVAVGVREVPGESIVGFSNGAVRLQDVVESPEFSGGLAAGAGRAAAVAKVTAERAAQGAVSAATTAARAAKRSSLGKRASLSWKGFTEGIKEGLADEGDEESR